MKKLRIAINYRPAAIRNPTGVGYLVFNLERALRADPHVRITKAPLSGGRFRFLERILGIVEKRLVVPIFLWAGRFDFYVETEYFYFPLVRLRRCRTVNIVYDIALLLYPDLQSDYNTKYFSRRLPVALRNSDLVLSISRTSAQDITQYLNRIGLRKTVDYVYCDAPLTLPGRESVRHSIVEVASRRYLLFVGTLEPRKNPLKMMQAYSLFIERHPETDCRLIIAGGRGWLYDRVLDFIEQAHLDEKVTFTGYVSDAEKQFLIANATGFVLLSLYEGFGIPVLEALRAGTNVLISDIAVFRELYQGNAMFVDPYDVDQIAEGMYTLSREKTHISPVGLDQFDWDKSAGKLVKLLQEFG